MIKVHFVCHKIERVWRNVKAGMRSELSAQTRANAIEARLAELRLYGNTPRQQTTVIVSVGASMYNSRFARQK